MSLSTLDPWHLPLIRGKLEEHGLLRDAKLYEINQTLSFNLKILKQPSSVRLTRFQNLWEL